MPLNNGRSVTDDTLVPFEKCINLSTIKINNCIGIKKSLSTFLLMKNVTVINCIGIKLPQPLIAHMMTDQKLAVIKFGNNQPISNYLKKYPKPQPNLKKLDIFNWQLDFPENFDIFTLFSERFPNLESLTINIFKICNYEKLRSCTKLRSLRIGVMPSLWCDKNTLKLEFLPLSLKKLILIENFIAMQAPVYKHTTKRITVNKKELKSMKLQKSFESVNIFPTILDFFSPSSSQTILSEIRLFPSKTKYYEIQTHFIRIIKSGDEFIVIFSPLLNLDIFK